MADEMQFESLMDDEEDIQAPQTEANPSFNADGNSSGTSSHESSQTSTEAGAIVTTYDKLKESR